MKIKLIDEIINNHIIEDKIINNYNIYKLNRNLSYTLIVKCMEIPKCVTEAKK